MGNAVGTDRLNAGLNLWSPSVSQADARNAHIGEGAGLKQFIVRDARRYSVGGNVMKTVGKGITLMPIALQVRHKRLP